MGAFIKRAEDWTESIAKAKCKASHRAIASSGHCEASEVTSPNGAMSSASLGPRKDPTRRGHETHRRTGDPQAAGRGWQKADPGGVSKERIFPKSWITGDDGNPDSTKPGLYVSIVNPSPLRTGNRSTTVGSHHSKKSRENPFRPELSDDVGLRRSDVRPRRRSALQTVRSQDFQAGFAGADTHRVAVFPRTKGGRVHRDQAESFG